MASRIVNAAKQIKIRDFLAPLIFLALLMPSIIFRIINKIKGRRLWLIAEDGQARDNGYYFYRYVRLEHPEDYCYYAVKKESAGYKKVSELGNVIKWGSIKHWLYYMAAELNISSQKSGNPCPILWFVLHVTLGLYNNRVFLQHGVIHNDSKWIYYENAKFKYFVCSTNDEYSFILHNFHYTDKHLMLTGLPRWDNLKDESSSVKEYSVIIMPTWRKWLDGDRNSLFSISEFEKTDYYKYWNGALNDEDFVRFVEQNDIKVYFYLHSKMQRYANSFKTVSRNIEIVTIERDIQSFFNKCNIMITDYSSVAFDFAYLGKPVIYYQFDEKAFRMNQHEKGYFSYDKDGFGPVVSNVSDLIDQTKKIYKNGLMLKYVNNRKKTFSICDKYNSKRVYEELSFREEGRHE